MDFIINQETVKIDPKASSHLAKEKSFFQKFFSRKIYPVPDDPYFSKPFVVKCHSIIEHPLFEGSITFVILLNTICLAMDKYPAFDQEVLATLSVLNLIFTAIFTFEVVVKMTALGAKEFMKEGFNVFDLFIVITSLF